MLKWIGNIKGRIISNIRSLLKFDPMVSLRFISTNRLSERTSHIEELAALENELHDRSKCIRKNLLALGSLSKIYHIRLVLDVLHILGE